MNVTLLTWDQSIAGNRPVIFCRLDHLQLDARSGPSIDVPWKGHKGHAGDDPCNNLLGSDLDERRG